MAQKYFSRSVEPYLGFGEFFVVELQAELEARCRSVQSAGYVYRQPMYVWEPDAVIHAHAPGDFLFSHNYGRHTAAEVDTDLGRDVFRVFTLGGSLAQGYFASSKSVTWHSGLEQRLNTNDAAEGRSGLVRVYSCSMGGFVSTQERLTMALAISPRKPDMIVILNGGNDLILPLSHGVRPGDPYLLSTLLKYWYERPVQDKFPSQEASDMLAERAWWILSDPRRRDNLFRSIVNVYSENMDAIAWMCQQLGSRLHIFFQPWRDKSREIGNLADAFDFSPEIRLFLSDVHQSIVAHMTATYPSVFHDLSHLFSRPHEIECFTDTIHVNDDGHRILADVIASVIARSCRRS